MRNFFDMLGRFVAMGIVTIALVITWYFCCMFVLFGTLFLFLAFV